VEPPTGGPEDKTPAKVDEIFPERDSTGISRDASVRISFSEKIDQESFRKKIIVYPEIEFKEIKVKDNVLEISFEKELPETTICLFLQKGYMDGHGVKAEDAEIFYFSTSDSLEAGLISGYILLKGKLLPGGMAKLIYAEGDTAKEYYNKKELRTAPCDKTGRFEFKYLPTDGTPYMVWGFVDINGDGSFNSDKELSMLHPETLYLDSADPMSKSFTMNIIDPNEPGEVKGIAENNSGIDFPVTIFVADIEKEDKRYYTLADSLGGYRIPGIHPGKYLLSAFLDIQADSVPGNYIDLDDSTTTRIEPRVILPDTIKVGPGEKKDIPKLSIEVERSE
jgi:hypothetical protein